MSTLVLSARPQLLERESSANSFDSQAVLRGIRQAKQDARAIASSMQSRAYPLLEEIVARCSRPNWDGYGALPISSIAHARTVAFLDALPMFLPTPDIVPENDGEIAVEWDLGPERVFSVSIGESAYLHFAGSFGGGVERHGVEPFDGMVSQDILDYINRIWTECRRAA